MIGAAVGLDVIVCLAWVMEVQANLRVVALDGQGSVHGQGSVDSL